MKKLISLFSVIILLSSLCACGAKTSNVLDNAHIPSLKQSSFLEFTNSTVSKTNSKPTKPKNSSMPEISSTPENQHIHSFGNATCTEPAKCSCGAQNGTALGHKWTDANCKAPKTCSVCKITEGAKGGHSYKNGTCTVCNAKMSFNPKTDLIYNKDFSGNFREVEDELMASGILFDNNENNGLYCVLLSHNFIDNFDLLWDPNPASIQKVIFNGTTYYHNTTGQSPHRIEMTDTEIIVKNSFWDDNSSTVTLKLVIVDANTLKVTYSIDSDYPVGTILSTDWQSTIK